MKFVAAVMVMLFAGSVSVAVTSTRGWLASEARGVPAFVTTCGSMLKVVVIWVKWSAASALLAVFATSAERMSCAFERGEIVPESL